MNIEEIFISSVEDQVSFLPRAPMQSYRKIQISYLCTAPPEEEDRCTEAIVLANGCTYKSLTGKCIREGGN